MIDCENIDRVIEIKTLKDRAALMLLCKMHFFSVDNSTLVHIQPTWLSVLENWTIILNLKKFEISLLDILILKI